MSVTSGVSPIGDYTTGAPANKDAVDILLALIPNPDAAHGSGAVAVAGASPPGSTNTYLDEMSPGAAAQLRVELAALKAAIENV